MLDVRTDVPLAGLTTLGVGGSAARFVEAHTDADLVLAAREPRAVLLGGGSNVVIADGGVSTGLVVAIRTRGVSFHDQGDEVRVTAAAGEPWDGLVALAVERGLAGLECLSGIPGLVGATPIQNVGAYGQEISDTAVSVRAFDLAEGREVTLTPAECRFGYRDSAFKSLFPGRFVVLDVTFALRKGPPCVPAYKELTTALAGTTPVLSENPMSN